MLQLDTYEFSLNTTYRGQYRNLQFPFLLYGAKGIVLAGVCFFGETFLLQQY